MKDRAITAGVTTAAPTTVTESTVNAWPITAGVTVAEASPVFQSIRNHSTSAVPTVAPRSACRFVDVVRSRVTSA